MVVGRQVHRDPFAECWRAFAHVHGDIADLPVHHAHQLALGVCHLVVQPTEHALDGARVVVLDELHLHAGLL
ncbi:hypothetical protein D3C78_1664330 [compost metagenome]